MNIKFSRLVLHNFMSYGDAEVNLDDAGYVLVSGVNKYSLDSAKSNGSGKSSLFESITWALTGETVRETKKISNKLGKDGTFVEINFNIDSDLYKVIRYKDYSNIGTNLKIFVNGEDKSGKGIRDTEKLLEQYLPDINSSLIGSVIILGQGLPQRFTNNTPSGRKEVLEKLSKSDFMIEDIKEKLTDRKNKLNSDLRKSEDTILGLENKKSLIETNISKAEDDLKNIPIIDYDSEIVEAENEYSLSLSGINDNEYLSSQSKLNEARNAYKIFDLECKNELSELEKPYIYRINGLRNKITELNTKVDLVRSNITKLENIKDVCPTCGQKLPNVHKVDTSDLYNEMSKFIDEKNVCESELSEVEEEFIKAKYELSDNQKVKKDELEKAGKLERENFNLIEDKYNKAKKVAEEKRFKLEKLKSDRELYTYKYKELQANLSSLKEQLEKISNDILYNNIERDNIKSRCDVVNKMITIATRDFRGFLLSEIIKFIDQKAKEYCKEIFGTEEIEFKLDGNNIFIGYCGKEYESLSGGEKQKIDLIVQFSIRDMLSRFLNFSSNILVVDEIFDNLDSIGCQKVLNLIATKLTDVNSLFIITHHTDIDIPIDSELVIVKDKDGFSKIER